MDAPRPLSSRARWVLRIALVVAWASGVAGTVTSCAVLAQYRGPRPARTTNVVASSSAVASSSIVASATASDSASVAASAAPSASVAPAPSTSPVARPSLGLTEAEADVMLEAFERFRRTRLPLTAANFVLSIALVIGAARTIGRRSGGRTWLQQVCLATALFAGVEYYASRAERAYLVERIPAVRAARIEHQGLTREQAEATLRGSVRFSFLLKLLGQLGLFGGLAIALGRPSVASELATAAVDGRSVPPPSDRRDDGDT